MKPSYKPMSRLFSISTVSFKDLHNATMRCNGCKAERDVPMDRNKKLAENYQVFADARRAFDEKHAHCLEKADG